MFPSKSESFVNTFPEIAVSSGVIIASFDAIGASFTAETVIPITPVSEPPCPSITVYEIVGTEPLYPATGVNVYEPSAFTIIVPTPGIVAVVPAGYITPLISN